MVRKTLRAGLILCGLALATTGLAVSLGPSPAPGPGEAADTARAPVPRPVTIEDLAGLTDFGGGELSPRDMPAAAISHDGRRIALQLRRADPGANAYHLSVVVIDVRPAPAPTVVDQGGDYMRVFIRNRRLLSFPTGVPVAAVPAWSPDDRWIAYLRRDQGVTQLWRARSDGKGAEPLTDGATDVDGFRWSPDGTALLFRRPTPIDAHAVAVESEARSGFHYDHRFWPMAAARPFATDIEAAPWASIRLSDRTVRLIGDDPASDDGDNGRAATDKPAGTIEIAISPGGRAAARIEKTIPDAIVSPVALHARTGGHDRPCRLAACTSMMLRLWWRTADELVFLRAEGIAGRSQLGLYRWRPGRGAPRRLLVTNDMLSGCQPMSRDLLCTRETALRPRHLVKIDLRTGAITTLFDPNPGFAALEPATVRRISWTYDGGRKAFGDLVLPPHHVDGAALPLVIVQYMSRGFLRGGTGDEYPILPLAAAGFAVLSFDRPAGIADDRTWTDNGRRLAANVAGWSDRRHVLMALEAGIRQLIDRGIVDRRRIGITGLSDGASTVQYALLHSTLFAAAAVSSCCEDPSSLDMVGEEYRDDLLRWGYRRPADDGGAFWRDYSLAMHAPDVAAPILMQLADAEFRMALEGYEALAAAGKPVDMFVFPDEHHVKWQPAHRLAIYRRSIDWFAFWLKGVAPADPIEAARWETMRQRASPTSGP